MRLITALLIVLIVAPAMAVEVDELEELVGYTLVAIPRTQGQFEGADVEKTITLDNGWVFEFTIYRAQTAYRPRVAVFAQQVKQGGATGTRYKLLIEDYIYTVRRVR